MHEFKIRLYTIEQKVIDLEMKSEKSLRVLL